MFWFKGHIELLDDVALIRDDYTQPLVTKVGQFLLLILDIVFQTFQIHHSKIHDISYDEYFKFIDVLPVHSKYSCIISDE